MDMKVLYDYKTIVVAREDRTCTEIADDLFKQAIALFPNQKLATMTQLQHQPDGTAKLHIRISSVGKPDFKLSSLLPQKEGFYIANLVPIIIFAIMTGVWIALILNW